MNTCGKLSGIPTNQLLAALAQKKQGARSWFFAGRPKHRRMQALLKHILTNY